MIINPRSINNVTLLLSVLKKKTPPFSKVHAVTARSATVCRLHNLQYNTGKRSTLKGNDMHYYFMSALRSISYDMNR